MKGLTRAVRRTAHRVAALVGSGNHARGDPLVHHRRRHPLDPRRRLISLGFAVLVAGGLLLYGSARITVGNGELRAGRAHIALDLVGTAEPLDAEGTRRVAGVDADARAYLLLRPYLKRSVRIEITDPRDPAPYWLVSTRRPDKLVAALSAVTAE